MESETARGPIWFATPASSSPPASSSHSAGAAFVRRITELAEGGRRPDLDLRGGGVQVWLPYDGSPSDLGLARPISAAAAELGLVADATMPQSVGVGVDTLDGSAVVTFWRTLLGYEGVGDLRDPLARDPRFRFSPTTQHRPLRNRIHVDVAVPTSLALTRLDSLRAVGGRVSMADGAYHALVTDPEGNEADLLPVMVDGDRLDGSGVDDWRALFDAAVFYPTTDQTRVVALVAAAAEAADEAELPLLIDLRETGVRIGSGKDLWEDERFPAVARRVQAAARDLGLSADPTPLRFLQIGFDAVDVAAVREFWRLALRYEQDPRPHVTDIFHPHRLGPTLFFSSMDAADHARRAQRNRIRLELLVPADQLRSRVDAALAAGGRIAETGDGARPWIVTDPEGNELGIAATGP